MKKYLQKPLPKSHPRQKILEELSKLRETGITFPEHPFPKKTGSFNNREKAAITSLKKKEKQRKMIKNSSFKSWEYRDRYSYRKLE